jgi:transposase
MNNSETVTIEAPQAQLAALQAEVQELQVENARLRDENQRLREELKALKQAPFKPRRRRKSQRKDPTQRKPQGRKAGHEGSGRARPTRIDRTAHIPVGERCPDCGESLTGAGVQRERIVEDIEPVRPTKITCYEIERRWCPCCRTYKEAPVVDALPRHRLGLNVMLFVVYQKVALGLSYGKVQRELATYFGLQVSKGQLSNIIAEVADLFGPSYRRLIELLRRQAAVHVDETGWRVNGDNHWLWVFISDVVTLYVLSHSRGSLVPKALLGSEFEGSVISDFYSAYSPLEYSKGKCWAHLLRDAHELIEGQPPPDPERLEFKEELHNLFLEMGLALEQVAGDEAAREVVYQEMRERLQAFAQRSWSDADCCRLAGRIKKHLDDLLLWLRDPAVEATNNAAERALRPAVITRKTSFGSHSKKGALDFARLLSLIRTWEQQGHDFFSTAHGLLSQPCS